MRYTIPKKMSGTGSIHDIASDLYDREIAGRGQYAVVLASYYGGKGYTTHLTAEAAARQAEKISREGYSYEIIDGGGNRYSNYYGERLERDYSRMAK